MKIILVANKTLPSSSGRFVDPISHDYVYKSLKKLGHDVYFWDTTEKQNGTLLQKVVDEQPDLIFCCMTGDKTLTPYEPWSDIAQITELKLAKTFNWFCDDAWRFEDFSSRVCWDFHFCSTPEKYCLQKYREIGYQNITLGFWHADSSLFPKHEERDIDVSFCGQLNNDRVRFLTYLKNRGISVSHFSGITSEKMREVISRSKIGINFSKNYNAKPPALQVKGRMAEVVAGGALLVTEYTPDLEEHFKIDNEIVCFESPNEAYKKIKFLLENNQVAKKIANNGWNRFITEHESSARLSKILDFVNDNSIH